jgi:hypothetical protein
MAASLWPTGTSAPCAPGPVRWAAPAALHTRTMVDTGTTPRRHPTQRRRRMADESVPSTTPADGFEPAPEPEQAQEAAPPPPAPREPQAALRLVGGAGRIELRADDTVEELYRASYEPATPDVTLETDRVTVRYALHRLLGRISSTTETVSRFALSTRQPWDIAAPDGVTAWTQTWPASGSQVCASSAAAPVPLSSPPGEACRHGAHRHRWRLDRGHHLPSGEHPSACRRRATWPGSWWTAAAPSAPVQVNERRAARYPRSRRAATTSVSPAVALPCWSPPSPEQAGLIRPAAWSRPAA